MPGSSRRGRLACNAQPQQMLPNPIYTPITPHTLLQQPDAHLPAAKRRKLREREEYEEMEKDYALLRKLKKGKITAHEFDVAAGLSSEDEAE